MCRPTGRIADSSRNFAAGKINVPLCASKVMPLTNCPSWRNYDCCFFRKPWLNSNAVTANYRQRATTLSTLEVITETAKCTPQTEAQTRKKRIPKMQPCPKTYTAHRFMLPSLWRCSLDYPHSIPLLFNRHDNNKSCPHEQPTIVTYIRHAHHSEVTAQHRHINIPISDVR